VPRKYVQQLVGGQNGIVLGDLDFDHLLAVLKYRSKYGWLSAGDTILRLVLAGWCLAKWRRF
jgi:hypothetical protein